MIYIVSIESIISMEILDANDERLVNNLILSASQLVQPFMEELALAKRAAIVFNLSKCIELPDLEI